MKMIRGLEQLSNEHKMRELELFNIKKKRFWGSPCNGQGFTRAGDFLFGQIVIGHREKI